MVRNTTRTFLVAGTLTLAAPRMAAAPTAEGPAAKDCVGRPEEKAEAVHAESDDDRGGDRGVERDDGADEHLRKKSKASGKHAEPSDN